MKPLTIVSAIVILAGSSGYGANRGDSVGPEERIQELIEQLEGRTWDRASQELVKIGEPAVDPLLRALNQNSHWISARASDPLSKIRSKKAVGGLLRALDNATLDDRIRRYILQSLGNSEFECVLEPLIQYLRHDDWAIRCAVLGSLGQIGGKTAEQAVIGALKDGAICCGQRHSRVGPNEIHESARVSDRNAGRSRRDESCHNHSVSRRDRRAVGRCHCPEHARRYEP